MSELTKEFFVEHLEKTTRNFVSKEFFEKHAKDVTTRLDRLEGRIAGVENRMVSKNEFLSSLSSTTSKIIKHVDEKIDDLAGMVARGFLDVQQRLDVTDRVKILEKDMGRIKSALSIE